MCLVDHIRTVFDSNFCCFGRLVLFAPLVCFCLLTALHANYYVTHLYRFGVFNILKSSRSLEEDSTLLTNECQGKYFYTVNTLDWRPNTCPIRYDIVYNVQSKCCAITAFPSLHHLSFHLSHFHSNIIHLHNALQQISSWMTAIFTLS